MKVGDLREILSHVDDDADVAVVLRIKHLYHLADILICEDTASIEHRCTCPLTEVEYNRNRELLEIHSRDADEAIESLEAEIDDLEREVNGMEEGGDDGECHCCTECGHWSPMDGKCALDGDLYHGWETACEGFVMETDTR